MHKHTVREEVSQVWNEHKWRRYKKAINIYFEFPYIIADLLVIFNNIDMESDLFYT